MQSVRLKVYSIDGVTPVIHPLSFVHPEAVLIGDVIVEEGCYIGPCASLRGDFGRIIVQKGRTCRTIAPAQHAGLRLRCRGKWPYRAWRDRS